MRHDNMRRRICTILLLPLLPNSSRAFVHPRAKHISHISLEKPTAFIRSRYSTCTSVASKRSPLGRIGDFFEEATASTIDYLLMQPQRTVPPDMRRVRTQFIAALADPQASSSESGAEQWGIWRVDPGPRGVYLSQYDAALVQSGGRAPAGWTLDKDEFWIEEYGRIMEKPSFPVPPGRYLVTGGRQVTTILTIGKPDASGTQSWSLENGARLYDVTHLPCRSAKYTPAGSSSSGSSSGGGSPADANIADFPVTPGGPMPPIQGCNKQDYAVLFVLAVERDS